MTTQKKEEEYTRLSLLETAELAYHLTSVDWNVLNCPESFSGEDFRYVSSFEKGRRKKERIIRPSFHKDSAARNNEIYTENILALLHIRIIALLYNRDETPKLPTFRDLSTTTLSRTIMAVEAKRLVKSKDDQGSRSKEEKLDPLDWPDELSEDVSRKLRKFIFKSLCMYRGVFYHNSDHAHHVFLNANCLLDSLLCELDWASLKADESGWQNAERIEISYNSLTEAQKRKLIHEKVEKSKVVPDAKKRIRPTYGIKSNPVIHFGFLFSALIHDINHQGVPNMQLVKESDEIALMYNDQSVQEQRSLAIAFAIFMKEEYKPLRSICFQDRNEFLNFRSNVINLVLCTDISSPERIQILKSKWAETFGDLKNFPQTSRKIHNESGRSTYIEDWGQNVPEILFGSSRQKNNVDKKREKFKESKPEKDVFVTNLSSRIFRHYDPNEKHPTRSTSDLDSEDAQLDGEDDVEYYNSDYSTVKPSRRSSLGIRKAIFRSGAIIENFGGESFFDNSYDRDLPNSLIANVILELMLNTADVGANMQKWEVMLKWSANLFDELKTSFVSGRGSDPENGWHGNQISFYESYVLPLTSSITEIEILDKELQTQMKFHVYENHTRWKSEGMKYVDRMIHPWSQLPIKSFSFSSKNCVNDEKNDMSHNKSFKSLIGHLRGDKGSAKNITMPTQINLPQDPSFFMSEDEKYENIAVLNKVAELEDNVPLQVDFGSISGLRYVLACYFMFMNIGSNESWGSFANMRCMPWHEHLFFLLGGYTLALPMNPVILTKSKFVIARLKAMYPLYLLAVTFGLINLIIVCRPSTFKQRFHWESQPNDLIQLNEEPAPFFCEGTPAIPSSYWGNLCSAIALALIGFTVTPFWPMSWFIGYYFWFNNIYYQCLAIYPITYNSFMGVRKRKELLLRINVGLVALSCVITVSSAFIFRNISLNPSNINEVNTWIMHFVLFGPFWMLYFIIGISLAYLYDSIKPGNGNKKQMWGWIADICTLFILGMSVFTIYKGPVGISNDADDLMKKVWATIVFRFACPLTTLWVFALSTGQGYTSLLLRDKFLVNTLSPNTYSNFLFHQMVAQAYFAITRPGSFWNYWSYRETFYWFAPQPLPVEWYEYFLLVGITTYFSHIMHNCLLPFLREVKRKTGIFVCSRRKSEEDDIPSIV